LSSFSSCSPASLGYAASTLGVRLHSSLSTLLLSLK
jgi:hypothetical protein